eukprot:gene10032-8897_t
MPDLSSFEFLSQGLVQPGATSVAEVSRAQGLPDGAGLLLSYYSAP